MNMETKPTILITGAGGLLGGNLIERLLKNGKHNIVALSSQKNKIMKTYGDNENLSCFNIEEWKTNKINFNSIDILINCAFARSSNGKDLASSLDFTNEFMTDATKNGLGVIINISSQSVYSQQRELPAKEETEVTPESLYAVTKYSSELLTKNICENAGVPYTNLRLGSLVGKEFDVRLTNRFVNSAVKGDSIKIVGGKQIISYMDVRDAADGLIALSNLEPNKWKKVYNFGTEESHKLLEIAKIVKRVAPKFISKEVNIEVEEGTDFLNLSMDCTRFYEDTSWKPKYDMEKIIWDIFVESTSKHEDR